MRTFGTLTAVPVVLLFLASNSVAQDERTMSEAKFYRLDFSLREMEGGKLVNSRNYFMTVSSIKGFSSSIRSNDRIPTPSGSPGNYTYIDTGVNIDCRNVRIVGDEFAVSVNADISGAGAIDKTLSAPIIRKTQWNSDVIVPIRKPTTIFSSDMAGSRGQLQLELTVTPVK